MANRIYPAALPNPCTPLGHDGTDFRALLVDSSAHLQADVLSVPVVTVQAAGGDKLFSFYAVLEEALYNDSLAAGTNYLSGTPVPAGEIWQVLHASILYEGTVPVVIMINVVGLANVLILFQKNSPVSGLWYPVASNLYLQVGDSMQGYVYGATLGDNFHLRYAGMKMYAP